MHSIPDRDIARSGSISLINRRDFLIAAGAGAVAGSAIGTKYAQVAGAPPWLIH